MTDAIPSSEVSRVTADFRRQFVLIALNLLGMAYYLSVARQTWSIDFALGGLFWQFGVLRLELLIFAVVNSAWLVALCFRGRDSMTITAFVPWLTVVALWLCALSIDFLVFQDCVREAERMAS